MELKIKYFVLSFINGQEFVVETDAESDKEFLDKLEKKSVLGGGSASFTIKQKTEANVKPRTLLRDKIFGVQELDKDGLNPYGKVWNIV